MGLDQSIRRVQDHDREETDVMSTVPGEYYYMRKHNHIQQWIEDNVGFPENCENTYMTLEELQKLVGDLKEVMSAYTDSHDEGAEVAKEKMPTSTGFFFGDASYDDYYFNKISLDLENLETMLDKAENDAAKGENVKFAYWCWW